MGEVAVPWIMLAATVFAASAAIFTWLEARAISKSTTASNLVNCLNSYITIMRARTKALEDKSEQQCKDCYRELFDLHWTEFQLWQRDMIPDHTMNAWLRIRNRNYRKDSMEFLTETGQKISVTYQQEWERLKDIEYFEPDDPFRGLMDKAHREVITDMKKLREEFKRK